MDKIGSIRKSGTSYSVTLLNSSSSAASGTLTLEYSGGKTLYTWTIQ